MYAGFQERETSSSQVMKTETFFPPPSPSPLASCHLHLPMPCSPLPKMMQELQKQNLFFLEVRTNTKKIPLSSNTTTASKFSVPNPKLSFPRLVHSPLKTATRLGKYEIPACNPTNLSLSLSLSPPSPPSLALTKTRMCASVEHKSFLWGLWDISNFLFYFF